MKPSQKLLAALCSIIVFLSCNNNKYSPEESPAMADSATTNYISSSAAVENNKDSTRKFIRTADLKFKVKDVIRSTYDIENIVSQQSGFVTYTNLTSTIDNITTVLVSADSSLETTAYTVTNSITLRVPNIRLDTTLKEIAKNIDYLDYRIIKAEDVALQILSNNLAQKRFVKNTERLSYAIDNRGKKLAETTNAEELLSNKEEQSDNAKIANLSMADQINFSTVNISMYQRQAIKRALIANDKNIDAYEPGFGRKILEAIKYGWKMFEAFFVFVTKLWWVFLLGLIVYIMYKKINRKI
ncbi:DUF4349 domain-containing protein [Ferruginibacter lapsinanis]|uniref:DUF4349 domain-containing protein n=1 Tax=Ferruginibacter lapsinanis TaxID=563172 RepID=UPI001E3C8297|nr:DUF4349 domain-containing protein [Ferruginibacter lapsinanis]UEG48954.1 DUF4349 domain-containing protein [Ferruginibacter lapsinanis]